MRLGVDFSEQSITRDEAVQLWTHILRHGIAEIFQASTTSSPLRAEACAVLATVGSQIFECLPVCLLWSILQYYHWTLITVFLAARPKDTICNIDPWMRQWFGRRCQSCSHPHSWFCSNLQHTQRCEYLDFAVNDECSIGRSGRFIFIPTWKDPLEGALEENVITRLRQKTHRKLYVVSHSLLHLLVSLNFI